MFSRLLDVLSTVVIRRRWAVLGGLVAMAALFAFQATKIRADFTPSDLFATFEDQEEINERFRETYGNTDNVLLVLLEGEDVLREQPLEYIHGLSRKFKAIEDVSRVESVTVTGIPRLKDGGGGGGSGVFGLMQRLAGGGVQVSPVVEGEEVEEGEVETLRTALQDAPLITGRLISEDHSLAAITVFFGADVTKNRDIEQAVREIEDWVGAHPAPDGYETLLAGLPYVRLHIIRQMRADQTIMLPTAILVCLLILFGAFRWLPAAILPLIAVVLSVIMIVGGMAWVGEPFNVVNNIVPLLVIVIGISDAIHLINRYGEEYAECGDKKQAGRRALRYMASACFLTSFTTAAGFASLAVSKTDILARFGITAAIGILCVYVVTITLLPAMLTLVGPPEPLAKQSSGGFIEEAIESLTSHLLKRPVIILVVGVALAGATIFGANRIEVDNAILDQLDESDEVYQTTRLIEEKLFGVRPLEVSFRSSEDGRFLDPTFLNRLEELERWARQNGPVLRATSPNDFLHEAWYLMSGDAGRRGQDFPSRRIVEGLAGMYAQAPTDPLGNYISPERDAARLSLSLKDVGAKRTIKFAEDLRAEAERLFGDMEHMRIELAGDAYVGSLGLDVVTRDLLWSVGTAFIIIFAFMSLVLRSLRLGLLSVPPNVLPLLLTMAYMTVMGIALNTATAIIFSISIGLAVDGTIHLLARFREEVGPEGGTEAALLRSARGTGKAILLTYVALMLGFGVMLFSSFVPVRQFGELIAITVLGCLAATILFVPPLLEVGWKK